MNVRLSRPASALLLRAVSPASSSKFTSAPFSININPRLSCPARVLFMRAVLPYESFALTLAPLSISMMARRSRPPLAAIMRGEDTTPSTTFTPSPVGGLPLTSAPACTSSAAISSRPLRAAPVNGVSPHLSLFSRPPLNPCFLSFRIASLFVIFPTSSILSPSRAIRETLLGCLAWRIYPVVLPGVTAREVQLVARVRGARG
mmetsp:Transcript_45800/g.110244  ORF Transcript_45800/g.110244 Transcript_45800/m.110244 type:complete len:203 (-) Transcript_45800:224-832(-)